MDKPPTQPFDEVTAFHEAGHAVVALALDRPVQKVSVIPGQELLGKCEFKKGVFRPSVDWLENEILIALAGLAAEARLTGTYDLSLPEPSDELGEEEAAARSLGR